MHYPSVCWRSGPPAGRYTCKLVHLQASSSSTVPEHSGSSSYNWRYPKLRFRTLECYRVSSINQFPGYHMHEVISKVSDPLMGSFHDSGFRLDSWNLSSCIPLISLPHGHSGRYGMQCVRQNCSLSALDAPWRDSRS